MGNTATQWGGVLPGVGKIERVANDPRWTGEHVGLRMKLAGSKGYEQNKQKAAIRRRQTDELRWGASTPTQVAAASYRTNGKGG